MVVVICVSVWILILLPVHGQLWLFVCKCGHLSLWVFSLCMLVTRCGVCVVDGGHLWAVVEFIVMSRDVVGTHCLWG